MKKVLGIICGILFLIVASIIFWDQLKSFKINDVINSNQSNQKIQIKITPAKIPQKNSNATALNINAKAAYLIDVDSALPLFSQNETQKLPIASTTKIATAMVVLDNYKDRLNDTVTITQPMINVIPSVIGLKVGEKITVDNLLNGMLIMSGNDAAYSLTEYFGGKEKFVAEMNAKAREIGLENTEYKDPAGLNDEGYSTAKDLALIASYALHNPKFLEIVSTSTKTISSTNGQISHELISTDKLIVPTEKYYYPNIVGGKTGYTDKAGRVLVSLAKQDNRQLLAVIINTNDSSIDAAAGESKKLFEWGFGNFTW